MSRRRRPLVPHARAGLDALKAKVANVSDPDQAKYEVAEELDVPLQHGYNGQLSAHDAGASEDSSAGTWSRKWFVWRSKLRVKKIVCRNFGRTTESTPLFFINTGCFYAYQRIRSNFLALALRGPSMVRLIVLTL